MSSAVLSGKNNTDTHIRTLLYCNKLVVFAPVQTHLNPFFLFSKNKERVDNKEFCNLSVCLSIDHLSHQSNFRQFASEEHNSYRNNTNSKPNSR